MTRRAPIADDIEWTEGQPPRSRAYGDIYFSREDGLAEARAVFLTGCGLPDAWLGRSRFTVAELGFGTGLNILALLDLWRRTRPAGARLAIFSVEAHLMPASSARRALAVWPELSSLAATLLDQWPRPTRGFHRVDFDALGATLDIALMEAGEALSAWSGKADAWFLDGFSPALNPEMWRSDLIRQVADRSAGGARLATYTVAGAVRRDLAASGFDLERKPGFGRKRERLEARLPGSAPSLGRTPRVAIIGGGIAGAALRHAFRALGVEARVFTDPASPPASAAPTALVAPRLDAGLGPPAALFAQAFHRAIDVYRRIPEGVVANGAVQLTTAPDDRRRFLKIADADLFDQARTRMLAEVKGLVGEVASEGLLFEEALVVDPSAILSSWLGPTTSAKVGALVRRDDGWRLETDPGEVFCDADIVVVAGGVASNLLAPGLALRGVRGQASCVLGSAPTTALLFGGYAIATREGLMFGATHDRDDASLDIRDADHARNRATLTASLPRLAAEVADRPATAHVGIRAATRDFLPLAGAVGGEASGLFVLSGLGSRGFCLAPLLAEHLVALAIEAASPLPADLAKLVDPARFDRRERRAEDRSRRRGVVSRKQ